MTGKIKVLFDRGFGFITTESEHPEDIFFHRTDCGPGTSFDELSKGDRVTFERVPSDKGPRAIKLQRDKGAA